MQGSLSSLFNTLNDFLSYSCLFLFHTNITIAVTNKSMDDDLLQDLEILGDGDDITNDDIDEVDVDTINAPDKVEDPFFKAGEIRDIDDVAKLRTSKLYISVIEVNSVPSLHYYILDMRCRY